jgi:hypothetical protein
VKEIHLSHGATINARRSGTSPKRMVQLRSFVGGGMTCVA